VDPEEERRLVERALAGDRLAEDELIEGQRGAAESVARRSKVKLDHIDEALSEVRRNLRRFEPARGVRFSSWAIWWIKASLLRAR
jgi:RNA polymerase nonessential primary-like sigma factor